MTIDDVRKMIVSGNSLEGLVALVEVVAAIPGVPTSPPEAAQAEPVEEKVADPAPVAEEKQEAAANE